MKVSSTQQTFLIVNGLIVTLVVLSFFLMRKGPRAPVKLDLTSNGKSEPPPPKSTPPTRTETKPARSAGPTMDYRPRHQRVLVDEDADTSPGRAPRGDSHDDSRREEVSLNVLFNWNGHTWDAYEVLGLPAGSSREKGAAAYQSARSKAEPESLPFLQAAYEAITRS